MPPTPSQSKSPAARDVLGETRRLARRPRRRKRDVARHVRAQTKLTDVAWAPVADVQKYPGGPEGAEVLRLRYRVAGFRLAISVLDQANVFIGHENLRDGWMKVATQPDLRQAKNWCARPGVLENLRRMRKLMNKKQKGPAGTPGMAGWQVKIGGQA